MIETKHIDEAETYILERVALIDGYSYLILLSFIQAFELHSRFLAMYVLYKQLLESILARAQSKYYSYGIKYLRKMDVLAKKIMEWKQVESHQEYFIKMRQSHGKKTCFWSKYV